MSCERASAAIHQLLVCVVGARRHVGGQVVAVMSAGDSEKVPVLCLRKADAATQLVAAHVSCWVGYSGKWVDVGVSAGSWGWWVYVV